MSDTVRHSKERDLIAHIKRLTYRLNQRHWTPQEVEAETLEGYEEPWLTAYDEIVARKAAIKLSRATVMADWQIERLNTWNRAIVLGGKHYQQWRDAYIAPIEAGWRAGSNTRIRTTLQRHALRQSPASDTPVSAQSPTSETAPRSR